MALSYTNFFISMRGRTSARMQINLAISEHAHNQQAGMHEEATVYAHISVFNLADALLAHPSFPVSFSGAS